MSVGREFASVYESLRAFAGCLNSSSRNLHGGLRRGPCLCMLSRMSVEREFASVYERFHVVSSVMQAVCVMGCSQGLTGAGGLVQLFTCVVRELYGL